MPGTKGVGLQLSAPQRGCWARLQVTCCVRTRRCTTPSGNLGKAYPPGVERCMSKLRSLGVEDIMAEYGLSNPARAETLKTRATGAWVWGGNQGSGPGNSDSVRTKRKDKA